MDYFEQIDEYLNNALSESEKIAFENEMDRDEKLKEAVENHGAAMDVVGSILENEVRKVIDNEELIISNEYLVIDNGEAEIESGKLEVENEKGNRIAKMKRLTWMRWAGAASVVFVLGWWGMGLNSRRGQLMRFTLVDSQTRRPDVENYRGSGSVANVYEDAIRLFNLNRFKEAKSKFFELEADGNYTDLARFCLGYIYFVEGEFHSSIKYFELARNAKYRIKETNQWLLYNHYILQNNDEMKRLQSEDPNLSLPEKN